MSQWNSKRCPHCGIVCSSTDAHCGQCGYILTGTAETDMTFHVFASKVDSVIDDMMPAVGAYPSSPKHRIVMRIIASTSLVILLVGTLFLGIQIGKGTETNNAGGSIPVSSPGNTRGIVLYQEDGSDNWKGWKLASDWKIVDNGILIRSDGSAASNEAGPSAIPPFSLPKGVQGFAIETTIAAPQPQNSTHFSITACGSMTNTSWQGYEGTIARDPGAITTLIFVGHTQLVRTQFDPGTGPHTYRLEIRKNVITLFVDHVLVSKATDYASLPCGTQVGLVSSWAVILVSSFKVFAL